MSASNSADARELWWESLVGDVGVEGGGLGAGDELPESRSRDLFQVMSRSCPRSASKGR